VAGWAFFGGVAQLLQVRQQFAALLIVLQRFDDFVQGLTQGLLRLWLFCRVVEQAGQTHGLGGRHRQQRHEADKE